MDEAPKVMTELDIAEAIRDGNSPSPSHLPNFSLFEMRVTGTGAAYRSNGEEHVWRDPSLVLTDEFLRRCNGLPVVFEHPEKGMVTDKEFADRIVGMVVLPYIKGEEIWAVCRVYDKPTIELIVNGKITSTSPGVVFGVRNDNRKVDFETDATVLIEGKPQILDHLAICEVGVWDKLGDPEGITITGAEIMTDEEKKAAEEKARVDAEKEKADAAPKWFSDGMKSMNDRLDAMGGRMDAFEKKDSGKKDSEEEEAKKKAEAEAAEKEAKDKKDSEDKAKEEKEAKDRLDALEKRMKDSEPKERSDEEASEMADAQAKCDSVASMFGKSARAPLAGESGQAYRRRLVGDFKAHSPQWKDVDLAALPSGAFPIAEAQIYADAQKAARSTASTPVGTLREVRRKTAAGHLITEFVGDPEAFLGMFKPPMRAVVRSDRMGIQNRGA